MVNMKPLVVEALETVGLPVFYELFVDATTTTPCITYMELNNADYLIGDTIEYSNLAFQIKVWSKSVSLMAQKSISIDEALKPLGFKRTFAAELFAGDMGQRIMRFEAIAFKK